MFLAVSFKAEGVLRKAAARLPKAAMRFSPVRKAPMHHASMQRKQWLSLTFRCLLLLLLSLNLRCHLLHQVRLLVHLPPHAPPPQRTFLSIPSPNSHPLVIAVGVIGTTAALLEQQIMQMEGVLSSMRTQLNTLRQLENHTQQIIGSRRTTMQVRGSLRTPPACHASLCHYAEVTTPPLHSPSLCVDTELRAQCFYVRGGGGRG